MVIADNEISAPKSTWKKPGVDEKSVDVPVLVVGTKSWPALSDAQTPKPRNHVENVAVPAYAFPPGSGPYLNGENPKPVSSVAAGQDLLQIDLIEPVSVQDPSEHSMEQQPEKTGTDVSESGHAVAILNSNDNNLVQAKSGAEGSNEANLVQAESIVPKSSLKRVVPEGSRGRKKKVHWADEKSDDVPVLVVGTKSWPALSDAQTPKPKNHVENVSAKGEDVAVSVLSVGQVASRAPSVQKSNGSGNFNPMNKMPSPRYQKPVPKRNVRPVAPPTHIAVPAYAFPPGSGPYPIGENPKPVSPVAAGQECKEPRRKIIYITRHRQTNLNERGALQDLSEHSMEQHLQKSDTNMNELGRALMKLTLNDNENKLVHAESVPEESRAPRAKQRKKVHWREDEESVDVPVLVVGKSWPTLTDVQTPKPKNHVDNVSAKGENLAVSVPSVGHIAPRAPSVQKANGSGNFNPTNKMPSPRCQKPGPKRNVRHVAPPTHIAVPAYAFPPGSGPYPNGANPKPVSPVAAGQENMERRKRKALARHSDLNEQASVQDPSERDQKKKRNSNGSFITLPANQQTRDLQQITQIYHLVLLYPIGTTPPDMKKLEKMRNWLAKEL